MQGLHLPRLQQVVLIDRREESVQRRLAAERARAVVDVCAELVAEAMRAEGLRHTPKAMLSRAVAVIRGGTLIINLPGSEKGVRESLGAVIDVLPHAADLLRGITEHPRSV